MMPELYLADALGAIGQAAVPGAHRRLGRRLDRASSPASSSQAGIHERVLTVAFEKQSECEAMWALSLPIPFQPPLHAGAGGYFAPHIRSYMRRSKAPDHIGILVALKDRQNALQEPLRPPARARHHLRLHQGLDDAVGPDPLRRDVPVVRRRLRAGARQREGRRRRRRRRSPAGVDPRHGDAVASRRMSAERDPVLPARRQRVRRRRLQAGRHHRPAPARSTASRCTCRSRGSSRCGSRTSASPSRGRGLEA